MNPAPHRLPDTLQSGVKEEVDRLVQAGIIEPSNSAWASVPVVKPDGLVRVCVDYKRVNSLTKADGYYMPTLDEILEKIGQCGELSKLDLCKRILSSAS